MTLNSTRWHSMTAGRSQNSIGMTPSFYTSVISWNVPNGLLTLAWNLINLSVKSKPHITFHHVSSLARTYSPFTALEFLVQENEHMHVCKYKFELGNCKLSYLSGFARLKASCNFAIYPNIYPMHTLLVKCLY